MENKNKTIVTCPDLIDPVLMNPIREGEHTFEKRVFNKTETVKSHGTGGGKPLSQKTQCTTHPTPVPNPGNNVSSHMQTSIASDPYAFGGTSTIVMNASNTHNYPHPTKDAFGFGGGMGLIGNNAQTYNTATTQSHGNTTNNEYICNLQVTDFPLAESIITKPIKPIIDANEQKIHKMESVKIQTTSGIMIESKIIKSDINSEFSQILRYHQDQGKKFIDPKFPPNSKSIMGSYTEEQLYDDHGDLGFTWGSLIWCHPDQFYGQGKYKVFNNGISWDDINQGALGDCYFLSTIASLAEWPHRIEKLIVSKEVNSAGVYSIRICDMGEWKEVILDDTFPCYPNDKTPVFSRAGPGELWVMLMEKAWAKMYGSYAKIEAGLAREALHDLSGAPTRYYLTDQITEKEKTKLWHDVMEGELRNFCMTCGSMDSDDGKDNVCEELGLVLSHAYSLLAAKEIPGKYGALEKVVQLRNPWGKTEWKGSWADGASEWTPEAKKAFHIVDRDDGVFCMAFNDFVKYFSDVQICKIHDDYHYTSLRCTANYKHASFLKMIVRTEGKYYITINQESKRHHNSSENYRHSSVCLILAKPEGNSVKHIEGCFKADREVFTEGHLKPGEYLIYVKIPWFNKTTRDFVASSYGPDDVRMTKITKSEANRLAEKAFIDKGRHSVKRVSYGDLGYPKCSRAIEITEEGYCFFHYSNQESKTLHEHISFKVLLGLKLCKPYRGKEFDITVAPGEEKVVLLKVDPDADSIKHSFGERSSFH
jgi:calpain-15